MCGPAPPLRRVVHRREGSLRGELVGESSGGGEQSEAPCFSSHLQHSFHATRRPTQHKQLKFARLWDHLFDRVVRLPAANHLLFEGGPHCFDHVSWGQGPFLLGFNESYHARDRVAVTSAVRALALDALDVRVGTAEDRTAHHVGAQRGVGGPEGAWDREPVVLHLRRDPDKQRRWIETPGVMQVGGGGHC